MRVISGTAKGRRLVSPKGLSTRPTSDRIKESLFNIIQPVLESCVFLDLFAGSGAIGIEALSRGAKKCFFVENDKDAHSVITRNLENTRLGEYAEIYFTNAETAIKLLSKKSERFDIIFMDPPYNSAAEMEKLTQLICAYGLLKPEGFIIGEHSRETDVSAFRNTQLLKRKGYGKTTAISFWRPGG